MDHDLKCSLAWDFLQEATPRRCLALLALMLLLTTGCAHTYTARSVQKGDDVAMLHPQGMITQVRIVTAEKPDGEALFSSAKETLLMVRDVWLMPTTLGYSLRGTINGPILVVPAGQITLKGKYKYRTFGKYLRTELLPNQTIHWHAPGPMATASFAVSDELLPGVTYYLHPKGIWREKQAINVEQEVRRIHK